MFSIPTMVQRNNLIPNHNKMCPSGVALKHLAGLTLLQYATGGCPILAGKQWSHKMMQAAEDRRPHKFALATDATHQLHTKVAAKVAA